MSKSSSIHSIDGKLNWQEPPGPGRTDLSVELGQPANNPEKWWRETLKESNTNSPVKVCLVMILPFAGTTSHLRIPLCTTLRPVIILILSALEKIKKENEIKI